MARFRHILYVRHSGDPAFADRLRQAGGIELHGITDSTMPSEEDALLASAEIYQISSGIHDIPSRFRVDSALLERMPSLLAVSTVGAGYDTVDVEACTQAGILVVNQNGGANAEAVVEHLMAMLLSLCKRIPQADRDLRAGQVSGKAPYVGINAYGKTIGIIGLGQIGSRLAQLCHQGFGMRVLATSSRPRQADTAGVELTSLDKLLAAADVVAICCGLNADTRDMIGAAEFARMRPGALFLTSARAGIHDEAALADALESGHLGGAGIDVWDDEPPPPTHRLLRLPNTIATPHTAGATQDSRRDSAQRAAEQVLQILAGARPPRLVNPDAWPHFVQRRQQAFGEATAAS